MKTSKYPWEDWLDGRVWLVRTHRDYLCLTSSIQSQAHLAAKEAGCMVATKDVGLAVLMQAYPVGSTWKPNLSAVSPTKIKNAMANPR